MSDEQFKVTADSLNLRSTPGVESSNRIAALPKGHVVIKLEVAPDDDWWRVSTNFGGSDLTGFVAHRFLSPAGASDSFGFPEPNSAERVKTLSLWATFYNVHTAQQVSSGEPILDMSGRSLGHSLSKKDWCQAAVEGTVRVLSSSGDVEETYNYAGIGAAEQVDCSSFFPSLSSSVISGTNKVRFKVSKGLYGEGASGFFLAPYRTIAIDKKVISIGSVIYIPAARGITVTLPSGATAIHDGYFFAVDTGSAIKDSHVDVFLGVAQKTPFPFVKSTSTGTFTAFLVQNPEIERILKNLHQL